MDNTVHPPGSVPQSIRSADLYEEEIGQEDESGGEEWAIEEEVHRDQRPMDIIEASAHAQQEDEKKSKRRGKKYSGPRKAEVLVAEKPRDEDTVDDKCIDGIREDLRMKRLLRKWALLKRIKDIYNEEIITKQAHCLRTKLLEFMRNKIISLDETERKVWFFKLTRLSFLTKLKEIRDTKKRRLDEILHTLQECKGPERERLLERLADLRNFQEIQNIPDLIDMREYKELKARGDEKKATKLKMMVKLKHLKKIEAIRKKEMDNLRKERIERLAKIVKQRVAWQDEMCDKIDKLCKSVAKEIVTLQERVNWNLNVKEQVAKEKQLVQEELDQYNIKKEETLFKTLEKSRLRQQIQEKRAMLERLEQEKRQRLWKSQKLKTFDNFLENREKLAQMDENRYFKRIFDKLAVEEKKLPDLQGSESNLRLDQKIDMGKKLRNWVQSVLASNKGKVLRKIKMKKFMELFDTPELDNFVREIQSFNGVQYIMCAVKSRILKNSFPERVKMFMAREFWLLSQRALLDFTELDHNDSIVNIHFETKKYNLYLGPGKDFFLLVQQKFVEFRPCRERDNVICFSKEDKEKILDMIRQRSEARKAVGDQRLADYAAYQIRKPLDEAWKEYARRAIVEQIPCWMDTKRDLRPSGATHISYDRNTDRSNLDTAMDKRDIPIETIMVTPSRTTMTDQKTADRKGTTASTRINFAEQMELRRIRLLKLIEDDVSEDKPRYKKTEPLLVRDVITRAKLFKNDFKEIDLDP